MSWFFSHFSVTAAIERSSWGQSRRSMQSKCGRRRRVALNPRRSQLSGVRFWRPRKTTKRRNHKDTITNRARIRPKARERTKEVDTSDWWARLQMAVTRWVPRVCLVTDRIQCHMGQWDRHRSMRRDRTVVRSAVTQVLLENRMLPEDPKRQPLRQRKRNVPYEGVNHHLIVRWGHFFVYRSQIRYEKCASPSSSGSILFKTNKKFKIENFFSKISNPWNPLKMLYTYISQWNFLCAQNFSTLRYRKFFENMNFSVFFTTLDFFVNLKKWWEGRVE